MKRARDPFFSFDDDEFDIFPRGFDANRPVSSTLGAALDHQVHQPFPRVFDGSDAPSCASSVSTLATNEAQALSSYVTPEVCLPDTSHLPGGGFLVSRLSPVSGFTFRHHAPAAPSLPFSSPSSRLWSPLDGEDGSNDDAGQFDGESGHSALEVDLEAWGDAELDGECDEIDEDDDGDGSSLSSVDDGRDSASAASASHGPPSASAALSAAPSAASDCDSDPTSATPHASAAPGGRRCRRRDGAASDPSATDPPRVPRKARIVTVPAACAPPGALSVDPLGRPVANLVPGSREYIERAREVTKALAGERDRCAALLRAEKRRQLAAAQPHAPKGAHSGPPPAAASGKPAPTAPSASTRGGINATARTRAAAPGAPAAAAPSSSSPSPLASSAVSSSPSASSWDPRKARHVWGALETWCVLDGMRAFGGAPDGYIPWAHLRTTYWEHGLASKLRSDVSVKDRARVLGDYAHRRAAAALGLPPPQPRWAKFGGASHRDVADGGSAGSADGAAPAKPARTRPISIAALLARKDPRPHPHPPPRSHPAWLQGFASGSASLGVLPGANTAHLPAASSGTFGNASNTTGGLTAPAPGAGALPPHQLLIPHPHLLPPAWLDPSHPIVARAIGDACAAMLREAAEAARWEAMFPHLPPWYAAGPLAGGDDCGYDAAGLKRTHPGMSRMGSAAPTATAAGAFGAPMAWPAAAGFGFYYQQPMYACITGGFAPILTNSNSSGSETGPAGTGTPGDRSIVSNGETLHTGTPHSHGAAAASETVINSGSAAREQSAISGSGSEVPAPTAVGGAGAAVAYPGPVLFYVPAAYCGGPNAFATAAMPASYVYGAVSSASSGGTQQQPGLAGTQ